MPIDPERLAACIAAAPDRVPARNPHRYRRGGQFLDPHEVTTPLDRNERVRLLARAEALEARTRQRGRVNGVISQVGLRVLKALLLRFTGSKGACFPSYSAIMRATGLCRASVAAGLARLERAGLVRRVRRLVRGKVRRVCPWTGELQEFVTTLQASSCYVFGREVGGVEMLAPAATQRSAFPPRRPASILAALGLNQPSTRDKQNRRSKVIT